MIELLEGQPERVHLLVAGPAVFLAGHPHPVAQRAMPLIGQHGIDRDRHLGDFSAEQLLANPAPAMDGVVVEVARLGHQPRGMRQQAEPVLRREVVEAMGIPVCAGRDGDAVDFDGRLLVGLEGLLLLPVSVLLGVNLK